MQSAFLEMYMRFQERQRYITDTRSMYRRLSGQPESFSSLMPFPQVESSDKAYDQMSDAGIRRLLCKSTERLRLA